MTNVAWKWEHIMHKAPLKMQPVRSRQRETPACSPQHSPFSLPHPPKVSEVATNLHVIQTGSNNYYSYYPSAMSPKSEQDLTVSGSEQTQKKELIPAPEVLYLHCNKWTKSLSFAIQESISRLRLFKRKGTRTFQIITFKYCVCLCI